MIVFQDKTYLFYYFHVLIPSQNQYSVYAQQMATDARQNFVHLQQLYASYWFISTRGQKETHISYHCTGSRSHHPEKGGEKVFTVFEHLMLKHFSHFISVSKALNYYCHFKAKKIIPESLGYLKSHS